MVDELIEDWLRDCDLGAYDRNEDGTWNYIDVSGWINFKSFKTWLDENKIRIIVVNEQ